MTLHNPDLPDFWHTTRGHDPGCAMGKVLAEARGKAVKKIACTDGCRHGEPWPTLRLLPAERPSHYRDPTAGRGSLS